MRRFVLNQRPVKSNYYSYNLQLTTSLSIPIWGSNLPNYDKGWVPQPPGSLKATWRNRWEARQAEELFRSIELRTHRRGDIFFSPCGTVFP